MGRLLYFLFSIKRCVPLPVAARSCSSKAPLIPDAAAPAPVPSENESLLENLSSMGVDLAWARRRQPGVLRRALTNEDGLAHFLKSKGAKPEAIASIITRFPRSITRSCAHLEERWCLWRSVFTSDAEVVDILSRSPESFFRSSDNTNLAENIVFLKSLGITTKGLHRLLTTAPRTFSNSVELNRNMVEFLESMSLSLGGTDHKRFARVIISKNLYVLIRSTNRVGANVEFLTAELRLSEAEALVLLQGSGAHILDLSHESLKKNFSSLRSKLQALGCSEDDFRRLIQNYSILLYMSAQRINRKLDCLISGGVRVQQILQKPKVLDFSLESIERRLRQLNGLGYDFQEHGIAILDMSNKRFDAKLERLQTSAQD